VLNCPLKIISKKSKNLMKTLKILGISLVVLTTTACVNIIRYERPESGIKPLKTTLKRIILHEDYISAENDTLGIKEFFFNELADQLSNMKAHEVIVLKSGTPLPKLGDNKGSLWIVGDIWSRSTKQSGRNVHLKTLSTRSPGFSSSRDVLEHLHWEQDSVMSYTNLYFIELSENPKLLRSSITASNFTSSKVNGDRGTVYRNILTRVEFKNPDEEAKSFFSGASTDKRLAAGYQVVSVILNENNRQFALKQLAEASVKKHFPVQQ